MQAGRHVILQRDAERMYCKSTDHGRLCSVYILRRCIQGDFPICPPAHQPTCPTAQLPTYPTAHLTLPNRGCAEFVQSRSPGSIPDASTEARGQPKATEGTNRRGASAGPPAPWHPSPLRDPSVSCRNLGPSAPLRADTNPPSFFDRSRSTRTGRRRVFSRLPRPPSFTATAAAAAAALALALANSLTTISFADT